MRISDLSMESTGVCPAHGVCHSRIHVHAIAHCFWKASRPWPCMCPSPHAHMLSSACACRDTLEQLVSQTEADALLAMRAMLLRKAHVMPGYKLPRKQPAASRVQPYCTALPRCAGVGTVPCNRGSAYLNHGHVTWFGKIQHASNDGTAAQQQPWALHMDSWAQGVWHASEERYFYSAHVAYFGCSVCRHGQCVSGAV